ncbi:hypothetical protein GCM10009834_18210 [Streptomonospora arabica]
MDTDPSRFTCNRDGQACVGGPHPTRWEPAVAGNGESGWMGDTGRAGPGSPRHQRPVPVLAGLADSPIAADRLNP